MIRKKQNKDGTNKFEASVKMGAKRVYQRFETHREARKWVDTVRFRRNNNSCFLGKVTVDMLFDAYLIVAENKGNAPTTIYKAKENFKLHLKPFYQELDMRTVTVEEHEVLLMQMRKSGLKPASCNRVRSLMHVMYSVAIRKRLFNGAFTSNPFACIEPAKEIIANIRYWTMNEVIQFLESEQDSHYYPLWVLLLNTGLRIGEAIAIHKEQIDTTANILTIDRIWCPITKAIRMNTKGGRIRHVGLNEVTQKAIYPLLKNGPLFTKPDGTTLTVDYMVKYVMPSVCKKAGIRNVGCHGFRHTFSAHYLMSAGNLWDLQKILGHHSYKTTEERYAHFTKDHICKRANVLSIGGNVLKVHFGKGVA